MFFVFILAFGVSFYSLIFGVQEFTWHLPRKIINLAYWHIFGEIQDLEVFEENFKANGYAAFILLFGYMTIVSILLVNLLIAMFSNTFDRLQNNADRIWKFQRYSLMCEYLSRPSFPPPFIFLSHCGRLTLYTLAKCCKLEFIQNKYRQHINRTKYKLSLDDKSITKLETTEDAYGDEVYYNYLKQERKLPDEPDLDEERVQPLHENILNRIQRLENHMRLISNQQAVMCDYLENLMGDSKTNNDKRIKLPERHLLDPESPYAYGDEVYYNYLKQERKLPDEPDLDEERVQPLQENILNRMQRLENHMRLISNQQAIMCDYLENLMGDSKTNNDKRIKLPERHLLDPESPFEEMNQNINKTQRRYPKESLSDDDHIH
ncbi:unnamed protein product [Rotaria sordida]|uniref:Uncharacterized protein n=1 Tax=Rotaria sordida TaxID=392033 RepID=A0A815KNK7_9BILA|nr:unnamed protein product [Rotaria sordida]